MIYRYASLDGPTWELRALPRDATRVNVAPDSWIDVEHLARVIAARALRPYAPLTQEPTP
jgi:hypothetical protein